MSLVTDNGGITTGLGGVAGAWHPERREMPAESVPARAVMRLDWHPERSGLPEPERPAWPPERSPEQVAAAASPRRSADAADPQVADPPMRDSRWMAAYMKQATDELRERARRYARNKALLVEYSGGRADEAYVEDMVEDVFTNTLLGVLSWNPDRGKLSSHVFLAIRSRIRHDWERAVSLPHVSMDAADETFQEVEDVLAETMPVTNAERALLSTEVIARLRKLAADDREVLVLLDAMCAGALDRGALMQATGMSARTYAAARSRLDRFVAELPQSMAR